MTTTIYEGGAALTGSPGGITPYPAPAIAAVSPSVFGDHWFVDGNLGADGNTGRDRSQPLKTMAECFTRIKSGATIYVRGNITEQLTAPAGVFDVTIIGGSTIPRHADAHTGNNGYSAATWKSPAAPAATTPLLLIRQQGWRIFNILFDAPADDACLEFMRDAGAGDAERDSSHAEVAGCRFASGATGILISGSENIFDVRIHHNVFNDLTHAIKTPIAANYAYRWLIEHNYFVKNTNHLVAGLAQSVIQHNVFSAHTTLSISLAGGAGENIITKNYLSGTYSEGGGYVKSNANDEWAGNWNTLAGGITIADPA